MILDSSAVVAIFFMEPGFEALLEQIYETSTLAIGAPTLTEVTIVLSARLKRDARGLVARFLQEAGVEVLPFGEAHFGTATDAWLRYGKGRHPAALNFGDCLAYASARLSGQPLLCTGGDFPKTDVVLA